MIFIFGFPLNTCVHEARITPKLLACIEENHLR